MALLRLLGFCSLLLAAVFALPISERYMWIPDSDGRLHIVDLLDDVSEDAIEPYFTGTKDVDLKLYTLKNPTTAEHIYASDDSTSPSFNSNNPTRFIIHGWTSGESQFTPLREAYMNSGLDYNVVIVDWSGPAASEYSISKRNSRRVGEYLAEVIEYLVQNRGLNLDDVYIIGHSLGAQAAGVAGNRLNGEVAQVVGLDAAAPLFGTTSLSNRLDSSDAKVVQGIHTNGGLLGWNDPLGDLDFFPNGGSSQAGCTIDLAGSCSHNRAPTLYAESITSQNFVAAECTNYKTYKKGTCSGNSHIPMGEWAPITATGNFYLNTNKKSPYAQGETSL